MNTTQSKKYLTYLVLLVAGLLLGWIFFHQRPVTNDTHQHDATAAKATIWTCSMHPQIRMDKPGKCPICGMDLIPLNQSTPDSAAMDPASIHLSREAAALANVETSVVSRQKPLKEVRLYGKVQADERGLQSQVAHIPGRIERLLVNFTGEEVKKGQPLAQLYSPELITAQQELLEAAQLKDQQPEIYQAARERLLLWKLTAKQIDAIEQSGKLRTDVDIVANTSGIVTARRVNTGDHVAEGTVLFDIADLSDIWVMFDAYESDLPFLNTGDHINFTVQALPGENFSGTIAFIDPVIDPVNRVSKVRVEINNRAGKLKPEMFVTGVLKANLAKFANSLVIPRSAVLWTGKRSVVYVKQPNQDEPLFKMREINIGPALGNSYIVLNGLAEGEEIVTQGTFNVDAAAQLEGKPSMMNESGGTTSSMPGMIMPGDKPGNNANQQTKPVSGKNSTVVSMDFTMQLNEVADKYIKLKNAFVASNVQQAKQAAQDIVKALNKVDMKLLTGDKHNQWMSYEGKLKTQTNVIATNSNLETQRLAFSVVSDQLYHAIKTFGLMDKTLYYQFCPMAFNNKGAYWLSEKKNIENPYFGMQMLTCGETKEVVK